MKQPRRREMYSSSSGSSSECNHIALLLASNHIALLLASRRTLSQCTAPTAPPRRRYSAGVPGRLAAGSSTSSLWQHDTRAESAEQQPAVHWRGQGASKSSTSQQCTGSTLEGRG